MKKKNQIKSTIIKNKKQLKKNSDKSSSTDPESIQKLIFEDVKNINKFNILIEEYILNLQNKDFKILQNYSKIILNVLEYFFVKNIKNISKDLISFLDEKLKILSNVLVDSIDIDEDVESNVKILNYLLDFMDYQIKEELSQNKNLNELLANLSEIFILNDELVDPSQIQNFSQTFFKNKKFFDILFITFSKSFESILEDIGGEEILYNTFNFLMTIPKIPNDKADLKSHYQNIIIKLINQNKLPELLLKNILLNLNKIIFDNLENPLIMSDYLINIYEKSSCQEFDLKVLSLSGLFVLITKYKLDYSNFYQILYKTVSMKDYSKNLVKTVFDSKYRNRIFKIVELSLKSPTVPIIVILSFIKKLARISLMTTSNNISIILGIIQNLIKHHPRSLILLHRVKSNRYLESSNKENANEVDIDKIKKIKENSKFSWEIFEKNEKENIKSVQEDFKPLEDVFRNENNFTLNKNLNSDNMTFAKYEQFDDDQIDPYKTKAHLSCLWEFSTLKNHYSFKIRSLIGKFERNFLKIKEFDMDSVSNLKEEDMLYEVNDGSNFYVTPLNALNDDNNNLVEIFYHKINNIV